MRIVDRVVVATDLSNTSRELINHAALVAAREGAELHLVHVLSPGRADPQRAAQLRQACHDSLDTLRPAADVPVLSHVVHASAHAPAIVREAQRLHADLLVVGTVERGPSSSRRLATVTQQVLALSPFSVLVVPRHQPAPLSQSGYRRPMAAVELSRATHLALTEALALSRQHRSEYLVAAHVVPDPVDGPGSGPGEDGPTALSTAARQLDLLVTQHNGELVTVLRRVVAGDVGERLCDVATACHSDLIVASGTGSAPGQLNTDLGPVLHCLLTTAPAPVLIVRSGTRARP